ncbi:hypothetical protein Taro_046853, partial [Colocasia esculenta]|nr:hypothetical protein [Colocasia esculenta]
LYSPAGIEREPQGFAYIPPVFASLALSLWCSCSRLATAAAEEGEAAAAMGTLGALLAHPEDLMPLVRLKMAAARIERQIPADTHWGFCYSMLTKVSRSFALVIQQLGSDLRNAVCIFYLVLRALDTVVTWFVSLQLTLGLLCCLLAEDDTSIPSDVKVPILQSFHRHVYDPNWHFSCGTKDYKVLMDKFHFVSTAFLELGKSYQEVIEDITQRMGAGMAKFICQEVETVEDYDEYCHYVAGLVGLGLSNLFHASGLEDLAPDSLSNSMGLFLQKTNIIRDYLEDINEVPKSRMFWPRQIWSKYADKLEDFKYEKNSKKAVECLNDMVTNALMHAEDCLKYMSSLRDPAIFRFCAIPQVMAMATLALCYNNLEVFRGVVKMRRGLTAQIIDHTGNMSDVYCAFFDFSGMLKAKVDKNDPNATLALKLAEAIQKNCINSGKLIRRTCYVDDGKQRFKPLQVKRFTARVLPPRTFTSSRPRAPALPALRQSPSSLFFRSPVGSGGVGEGWRGRNVEHVDGHLGLAAATRSSMPEMAAVEVSLENFRGKVPGPHRRQGRIQRTRVSVMECRRMPPSNERRGGEAAAPIMRRDSSGTGECFGYAADETEQRFPRRKRADT